MGLGVCLDTSLVICTVNEVAIINHQTNLRIHALYLLMWFSFMQISPVWQAIFTQPSRCIRTFMQLWSNPLCGIKPMMSSWYGSALYITGPFCGRITPVTSGSPHKGPVMQSFDVFIAVPPEQAIEQECNSWPLPMWHLCNVHACKEFHWRMLSAMSDYVFIPQCIFTNVCLPLLWYLSPKQSLCYIPPAVNQIAWMDWTGDPWMKNSIVFTY